MVPYAPQAQPLTDLDSARLVRGRYGAGPSRRLLQGIVNASALLSPQTNPEAVLSSRIEGAQATVDEVLEFEDEETVDIQEMANYRRTLSLATGESITLELIGQIQGGLLDSVRGSNESPGAFRNDQNWIGSVGCTMDEVSFVPPSPLQLQDRSLAFEAYLGHMDFGALVQTTVVHAQFEWIHPFKDGNGRIGRLMIRFFSIRSARWPARCSTCRNIWRAIATSVTPDCAPSAPRAIGPAG